MGLMGLNMPIMFMYIVTYEATNSSCFVNSCIVMVINS